MTLAAKAAYAVAYWKLDEASGSRADSVGSNTLSDNNTVASATGLFGLSAADFEADNQEYLSITDNDDVSVGDINWMLRFLTKFESLGVNRGIVCKRAAGNREYGVQYESSTSRIRGYATSDGSSFNLLSANNFGAPSTGAFYLVHFWHDADNNQIGIAINAGTADTTAHTGGIFNGTAALRIGSDEEGGEWMDGLVQDVVLLKGAFLDATERSEDYNGGAFLPFSQWAAGQPAARRFGLTRYGVWAPVGLEGVRVF